MTRKHVRTLFVTLFACGCVAVAGAADTPLSAFSNDADVVIRLQKPQQTVERAANSAAGVDPSYGDQVRNFAPFLGILISNATLAGVDQTRDWYVAVFARSDADPATVFAIPASDAAALQEALPEKLTRLERDGWVFYSENAEAVERVKSGPPAASASIISEIGEKPRQVFDRGDLSVFINVDHLAETYREQIEAAGESLAAGELPVPGVPALPGANPAEQLGDTVGKAQELLKDGQSLTLALTFNGEGLNLESFAEFRPGSDAARGLQDHPDDELASVSQLPADALLYFGAAGSLASAVQGLLTAAGGGGDVDPAVAKKLETLRESMQGIEYKSLAATLSLGDPESGLIRSVGIVEATPASKARELLRESTALMNFQSAETGVSVEAEYEAEAETVADRKVDVQSIQASVDPNVNPLGTILDSAMQAMYGPDGAQTRYVFWEDKYLQSIGGGPDAVAAALEQIEAGKTNATPEHRKELIAKPDLLVLLDVQRLLRAALKAADSSPNFPFPVDQQLISGDDPAASYIGFSMATEPGAVRAKLQVPGGQILSIVRFVMFARTLGQ